VLAPVGDGHVCPPRRTTASLSGRRGEHRPATVSGGTRARCWSCGFSTRACVDSRRDPLAVAHAVATSPTPTLVSAGQTGVVCFCGGEEFWRRRGDTAVRRAADPRCRGGRCAVARDRPRHWAAARARDAHGGARGPFRRACRSVDAGTRRHVLRGALAFVRVHVRWARGDAKRTRPTTPRRASQAGPANQISRRDWRRRREPRGAHR
jgi:hypothetical protein